MRLAAIAAAAAWLGLVALPARAQQVALPAGSDPNDWEAYYDVGVQLMRKHGPSALAAFERASRLEPSRAEPLHARFVAFWMSQSIEDFIAWRSGDRRLRSRPDVRAADSLYTLALQLNPFVHRGLEVLLFDRIPGRFLTDRDTRAWLAYSTGDFAEAVKLQTRSIERRSAEGTWYRYDRALSRVMLRDLAGARADLEAVLDTLRAQEATAEELVYYRSKHALLHMIGLIRLQQGDLDAARAAFGEALLENAGFAYAQAALANVTRAQRRPRDAVAELEAALLLAPDDLVIRWWYAQTLADAGRYDAAVAEARQLAEREQLWAAPHYVIGRARERQGRQAEAREAYATYLRLAPAKDPLARNLRQRFP